MKNIIFALIVMLFAASSACAEDAEARKMMERYGKDPAVGTVVLVRWTGGSRAFLQAYAKDGKGWRRVVECHAYVGEAGIDKRKQGDRRTPTGTFGVRTAFGIEPDPGAKMLYLRVTDDIYCCADKSWYNRIISVNDHPHPCSGEHMIEYVPQYDYGLFLDYNREGVPGRGTAIFIHCKGDSDHTLGCVAIAKEKMKELVRTADAGVKVKIFKDSGAYDSSGFVLLSDAAPEIAQEIRYASDHNFVGRPIDGYDEPQAILTREAADALRSANEALMARGLRLKVFDAYRPQRAVDDFAAWAADKQDLKMKDEFYPKTDKSKLFDLGYIAYRSGHSRGSTVDLTIVDAQTGQELDMGSTFDLFDTISHYATKKISPEQAANRKLLLDTMQAAGFAPITTEWWHFTLKDEPHKKRYHDFPVSAASIE